MIIDLIHHLSILFLIFIIFICCLRISKRYIIVNKHKKYLELFIYFMDSSYDIIYRNQVMSVSAQGYNLSGSELETVQRNFVKLSRSMMGSEIESQLIYFFGDENTLTQNIMIYFQKRSDNDELKELIKQNQSKNIKSEDNE